MEISPQAHMGLVELSVSDLDRSLGVLADAIGLRVLSARTATAELGADTPLVRFVEEPGASPRRRLHGPLPRRAARARSAEPRPLARARRRATRPARRASDHFVSRGDLPPRPRLPRDRDLRRPSARAVGGRVDADGHRPARRRGAARRARDRRRRALDGAARRHDVGHTHLQVGDVADTLGLLPRPARDRG